ncbi:tyrosine-type recombinase/integrase [Mesorhizobium sp. IMUNJ 23033]|uniref:tyrosine-type recombinase/integrase n=1 Tax=Mesorhizobium sp. IMUNJ 23033 TaxID=3378039 RepID=UPI00384CD6BF
MRVPKDSYIHKHPGSANLWYVRDIPEKLRHLLPPTKNGKQPTKWKVSLKTAIRREAAIEARKLASEHDAFIESGRAPDPRSNLSEAVRSAIDAAGGEQAFLELLDKRAIRATKLADEAESWRDFAAEETSPSEAPDPDWISVTTAVMDAERLQIERQLARDVPVIKALGSTPKKLNDAGLHYAADAVALKRRDPDKITLAGVVAEWKEHASPVAPEQYEYPVKLFEELNGALPVKQITVDHVRAFRDALLKMPPASGGKFDDKTMPEIIRLAERKGLKPLKASTAGKHFRCLKAIFTFAVDDGYVEVNVAAGIKMRRPKGNYVEAKKAKRRTFSPAEMEKLFAAAVIAPWRDKEENLWFLRLMTYTGARPEELAQLSARDIVTVGGHVCLSLHDEGDNHMKNPSSVRMVPVHPELLRLGFADFVKAADNRPYLFSTLEPDGRGRRYGRMQRRLTALINGKVSNDARLVPYSLRHTFRNTMENTDAPEWVIEGIMGHSNPEHKTGRGYGMQQVAKMAEFIAKADPFDKARAVCEFVDEEESEALE